jgi:hypothetical protein
VTMSSGSQDTSSGQSVLKDAVSGNFRVRYVSSRAPMLD